MRTIISLILLITFMVGCDKKTIDLDNFDEVAWQQDKNGCNSVRINMVDALEADKEKLKALNQDEIMAILGKPDANELYKRGQNFLIYFITPKNCGGDEPKEHKYLSIRFTAMGLAKEVLVYTE
ncbi:MAG TPA: hypothetical protein PKL31_00085 [Fulvivirga sp.]|nr:hypothetical protein [Fulvivirga sp.]